MPSEASTVGGQSVEELRRELAEAREQQTATSDVLRVISSSPTDLARVFDTILSNATRLCEGNFATLWQYDGEALVGAAHHNVSPGFAELCRNTKLQLGRAGPVRKAALERRTIHVADITVEPGFSPVVLQFENARTVLAVPLLREKDLVGVVSIWRREVYPFTEQQIALVQTFADQAVIAIENARLFEAEQASKRELQESLEYQTAISEVLGVISRSPTDVQPVFDTIAKSALHLCAGTFSSVLRFDGRLIHFVAAHGMTPEGFEALRSTYPLPPGRAGATTRAIETGALAEIPDVDADLDFQHRHVAGAQNFKSLASVPMLKDGRPIGTITVGQAKTGRFPPRQIALLRTFADQAVIAIENARLFEAEQTRTRELTQRTQELTETLEYQTATSDVLGVISRSPSNLQPVLHAIVETAARLCQADFADFRLLRDGVYEVAATTDDEAKHVRMLGNNPIVPGRGSITARAALKRRTIHVPDIQADPEYTYVAGPDFPAMRTILGVPLVRDGVAIGVIVLFNSVVRPFTQKQIALVTTFADQALIAIENTRLFEEVQARNRDLTALREVGRAVSSTLDLKVVLKTIVDRAVLLSGTDAGSIFYYREEIGKFELGETTGLDEVVVTRFRKLDISLRESGLAEAIARRQPLQIPDLTQRPSEPLRDAVLDAGFRASLVVPLLGAEGPLGTLILRRRTPGEFTASVVSLMQSFADQSVIALENARLFNEIAQKSRELEIASQHKSQFVANMSHELRTPLAAILGYAELMQEGFYEPLGQKSLDALTRIRSNGKHLLGLINTVLDIAKIESGQFTLNMTEYAIESVVETVRSATESLAQNKKLSLKTEVAKSLPIGLGDEQRLTQVLLNLVGNAIKFTDAGEVRLTAKAVNGHFNVSVTDTGPGIPEEHQARIFDQFHQVDSSNTKAKGGTGLGLAIAKEIVEMHGGRIWVESTVGKGSTFQMEIPTRAEFRRRAL
jgi:signal transduction histidine kinase/putative methionine-R-sulfoxide reductase with GAF domain